MPLSRGRGAGGRTCQSEAALKGLARRARAADATEKIRAGGLLLAISLLPVPDANALPRRPGAGLIGSERENPPVGQ